MKMAPPGSSGSQPLPQKEQALFKKIVKCYEHKQYKNGLKSAKQILSNVKYAEHGETLAMKGLILNCMGKRQDALEHVKKGLRNDVKSHVCWHVYGLVQRSEKKYDEAIKAYRNALRIEKDNMQILRDLSLLQIQMRDLEGYRDTRYQLLVLRPTQRVSWIGFAMAYHLLQQYDMALKILDEFRRTQTNEEYDFEQSELLLYQNMVLRESGQVQTALDHLESNARHIYDKLNLLQVKAELLFVLGRKSEAANVYQELIDRNAENIDYYKQLERCWDMDEASDQSSRLQLYEDVLSRHPRSSAPIRLPLTFLNGAKFLDTLKPFVLNGLRKGIPPLFRQLSSLYSDPQKVIVIENLFLSLAKSLEASNKLNFGGEESDESPTTLLWVYFYLAQHYDRMDNNTVAMSYIDKALKHTPTLIEALVVKAKIYKHAGSHREAVRWMDEAQALDTADRFINSRCAKYMLRAGMVEEAESMCAKFTRDGGKAVQSLNEMQCMWFETECARAYQNLSRLGDSLKKCHEVERHFCDILEDQFDFHTYCVRKMTLSAYVGLLRLEDVLRRHSFYYKAAKTAIKIYLRLFDSPDDAKLCDGGGGDKSTASELRKKMRKQKKRELKEQNSKENKPDPKKPQKETDVEHATQEPLDPNTLVKTTTPLDEAAKFVQPLVQLESVHINSYILSFHVYYRKGKVLPMLQAIIRAHSIDENNSKFHLCRVMFLKFLDSHGLDGVVKEIVDEHLPALFSTLNPARLNQEALTKMTDSHSHLLHIALASYFLDAKSQQSALDMATRLDDKLKDITWKTCKRVLKRLEDGVSFGAVAESRIESYKSECRQRYPLTDYFCPPSPSPPPFNMNNVNDDDCNSEDGDHKSAVDA